jgi:DMSO/TMAO reductase YedYZ heme-binding membrane subunit
MIRKRGAAWSLVKKVSVYAALLVHLHLCLLIVVKLIFNCSSHVQGEVQASSRLIRLTVVLEFTIGAVDRGGLAELDVVETSGTEGRIAFA